MCNNGWTDARRPILRPWIRSAEVQGGLGGGGGGGPVGAEERLYENLNTTTDVQ